MDKDLKGIIAALAAYLLIFISITSFLLEEFIPIELKDKDGNFVPSIRYVIPQIGLDKNVDVSTHFIVLVILGGALGGTIHGLAKLAVNTRDGTVKKRDALWHVSRPFLGVALAITVYVAIRGGIITTVGVEALNPYGITAISILVGLSSEIVTQKLKEVLVALFPTTDKKSEILDVLKRRLANGEIDEAKYDMLKKHIHDDLRQE